jgi:hypothetical protein
LYTKTTAFFLRADPWLISPCLGKVTNQWKNSISLRKSV